MKSIVLKKENGNVEVVSIDKVTLHDLIKKHKNPCISCDNAYTSKCKKVEDENKNINNYDFVISGYQINNELGETQKLMVCECSNYVVDRPRVKAKTREEIEKLNKLKESIKINYFNAIDIDEADQIQEDLINRGQISLYNSTLTKTRK